MYRPPRPVVKSSQMLPLHPLRRIITPQPFNCEQDIPFQEAILKSMRQNALPGQLHQSVTEQVNNAQYLELNTKPDPVVVKAAISSHTRSFKIRNYTHNNRIKENSIPVKSARKPVGPNRTSSNNHNTIETEKGIVEKKPRNLTFLNYPSQYELNEIGSRTQFRKIEKKFKQDTIDLEEQLFISKQAVIISQSLFPTNLNQQSTISKIKSICTKIKNSHPSILVFFRIQSDREIDGIMKNWEKSQIGVDYIFWAKTKHCERIIALDLTQMLSSQQVNSFLIFEDQLDYVNYLYYSCSEDQNQQMKINSNLKYLYLSFSGINPLTHFCSSFKINFNGQHLITDIRQGIDRTCEMMSNEEIKEKVGLTKFRKNLKAKRGYRRRQSSMKNIARDSSVGSVHNMHQKNEDFKRKMIQYVKILQEDKKTSKVNIPKPDSAQSSRRSGGNPLRLMQARQQSGNLSKTSNQIIYELLKINSTIFKQITKYREEVGLQIQSLINCPRSQRQ